MDWINKMEGIMSSMYKNDLFDYLKFIIYETDNKEMIEKKEKALTSLFVGIEEMNKQNFEKAIGLIKNSIDIFNETQDKIKQAFSEFFMGEIYRMKEEYEKAREFYQKSYAFFKERGNKMANAIEEKLNGLKK